MGIKKPQIYYWDSSALIKRYIIEEGSEIVSGIFAGKDFIHSTSVITHAEIIAAFYRIRREGRINREDLQKLIQSFTADLAHFSIFPYSEWGQNKALEIIKESSLKGADLIHLATAEEIQSLLGKICFVTFDEQLRTAASDRRLNIPLTALTRST